LQEHLTGPINCSFMPFIFGLVARF